ncbi:hypothetical protein [Chryseobacterium sp. A301]
MSDLDLLHFEQLKTEIQAKYLESHTPSEENIAHWKGIDIIYFQEDLRQKVKGNISEKSFYTYFKNSPVTKLPRIDILNLLSDYAGYSSWYEFKKKHLYADEILSELENEEASPMTHSPSSESNLTEERDPKIPSSPTKIESQPSEMVELDASLSKVTNHLTVPEKKQESKIELGTAKMWYGIAGLAFIALAAVIFLYKDELFTKEYYYNFIDSDRNSKINAELQVQILKKDESPILYNAKPNEPFVYRNPEGSTLTMVVSSPYYRTDTIRRNLKTAPESEIIELKPNDYAIMLYYYSNSIQDIKRKRESLNFLISQDALIYQVYDNDTYGIETLDKSRYINLVTTPTTSLKNMEVIDTKMEKGKIVLIKFRITNHEEL